jgi:8-oxo-dGTP pyrophosphatase MutT (NUDIX family)
MKSKLIEKYGLAATATDEEVMNAIEADKNKKPEVATLATAESVDAFMAIGKTAGLITDKNEAAVKAMAEKAGLKATSDFLATFEKPKAAGDELRLSDVVAALKGTVSAPKDKTWSEMTLAEKQALEIADPTKFEALFKASIGVVKNGESN